MDIILTNAGGQPIYDQIVSQIKAQILSGKLKEGDALPSLRTLARDLRISVITTKRAYEELEREGFIVSLTGKGSFVACANQELMLEEKKKEVESDLEMCIRKGRSCGMSRQELTELFQLVLEDII